MKIKNIQFYLILLLVLTGTSCKKFLEVESIERFSGNRYWKTGADVEAFTIDIYARLWDKLSNSCFWPAAGEFRLGEIRSNTAVAGVTSFQSNDQNRRVVYDYLAKNDMKAVVYGIAPNSPWLTNGASPRTFNTVLAFNFVVNTNWTDFYRVIQEANIMYEEVNKGIPGLSDSDKQRYLAEAVFIRCLTYFIMVRIYGDVAYYTDANHSTPLGREKFVSVLNKCIAELEPLKNNLPWKYEDPALNGVRANRGGAISLLMNMYMWNAGFDEANKNGYYEKTAALGNELIQSNQHTLIPIEETSRIFLGGTNESLIELKESSAFASGSNLFYKSAFPGEPVVLTKHEENGTTTHLHYKKAYIDFLFGSVSDYRADMIQNRDQENGRFALSKFEGPVSVLGFPDWGLVLFRYADAVLLQAEALANLGRDGEATSIVNMVRMRANAAALSGLVGQELKDEIFKERGRELLGEGYRFFDLVRTKRILDPKWSSNPLSVDQFNRGAWTWPIDPAARDRNPFMTLNDYWF
ncbi:RagB/SusD family nutrient uptake outer membrane protein [Pedobacter zeae]|nr:RagB/SusD family nutrient uptake outer membrane protein [Pedobacter zeae]MBB4107555.1 hypothetical protein [Pedobacter zeae]